MYFLIGNLFLIIAFAEKPLDDYKLDPGQAPDWLEDNDAKKKASVDRWYVDTTDATCKIFTYLGSLGNFNNFVSKAACDNHLKFTQEEKANACQSPKNPGSCGLQGKKALIRWYFSKAVVEQKTNECHKFEYTGCGGNANNFSSEKECKQVCQNTENGEMDKASPPNTITAIPNEFDCSFIPEVKTERPMMGIVPHKDGNRCVYAAVGSGAKRGFFKDLPICVKTCIKKQVAACDAEGPHQVEATQPVTTTGDVKTYYYFDKNESLCLPFMSKQPDDKTNIDDGALNIFKSAELCASYCPATGHIGKLKAVEACSLKKSGESATADKYKIARFYYDPNEKTNEKCKQFEFSGKNMNLNNFETKPICDAICKTPLSSE